MPYVGILRAAGLAKEVAVGTLNSTPDIYIPYIPPDGFSPDIKTLESAGIRFQPDKVVKASRGPAEIKGGKLKFEVEPENIGEMLMATFGQDAVTEYASFVVSAANNKIDFTEDGGLEVTATIPSATYIMGLTSATAGTLLAAIKTAMEAVNGASTYILTYSYSTKKVTITKDSGVFVLKWATGTNTVTSAKALLGFSNADTASAIAATSDSTTSVPAFQHVFTRSSVAQLPTYTVWLDRGTKYPQFKGCMMNKMDFDIKAKEYVMAESDWTGLAYDDTGTIKTPNYSARKPFVFNEAVVSVDASTVNDYDNLKVSIDNMVKAEHALSSDIYTTKIWTEGMRVTLSADLYVENATQWNKFLAGTSAAFIVTLTSSELIGGSAYYSLAFNLPVTNYLTAPFYNPVGVLKIPFTAVGVFDTATSKTMSATLVNSRSTSY